MAARATFTEEQITESLMAVVAWAGNYSQAARYLKAEKGLRVLPTTLSLWCTDKYTDRYGELREKYAAQLEENLILEYREVARQAVDVQRLALQRATDALVKGEDRDPSRTAANAARVAQVNTDKLLSLSGRPTSIREDRSLEEILRSLAAKNIIELPGEAVTEEATPALEVAHERG